MLVHHRVSLAPSTPLSLVPIAIHTPGRREVHVVRRKVADLRTQQSDLRARA